MNQALLNRADDRYMGRGFAGLRRSTAIGREVLDRLDALVVLATPDSEARITYVSPQAERQLKLGSAGGNATLVQLFDDSDRIHRQLQRLLAGQVKDHVELDYHAGDRQFVAKVILVKNTESQSEDCFVVQWREVSLRVRDDQQRRESDLHRSSVVTEAVSQIAAAVEELSVTAGEVAANTRVVKEAAESVNGKAAESRDIFFAAKGAIDEISRRMTETSATLARLSEKTKLIDAMVSTIQGIADQTNLLALNAAIEAARAGAAGRGFGVVADEVRQLASRARGAASEIAGRIAEVRNGTIEVSEGFEESFQEALRGATNAEAAAIALEDILTANRQVREMLLRINSATEQQEEATMEISNRLSGILVATEGTADDSRRRFGVREEL
ncbi:methyl-accepting chemotaxis protein [Ferrimicrobium acidiphilum]|uniref:methyl-accepting chemotaxis protein n=2 Tax=Ferrimicrobium TaxID=121038 RepID=UPI0023F16E3C|nr:methyl-accepting chemotaxis protein [Ferrimicrobium acidiphilum]